MRKEGKIKEGTKEVKKAKKRREGRGEERGRDERGRDEREVKRNGRC